jgi:hypothetical protein
VTTDVKVEKIWIHIVEDLRVYPKGESQMDDRALIRASILVGFLLATMSVASATEEIIHAQSASLQLEETLYLPGLTGEPMQLLPGSYRIEADEQGLLRVESMPSGTTNVVKTAEVAHLETVSASEVRLIRGNEDERSILLLLPGGKGLLSEGSSTGVQTRQVVSQASALSVGNSRRIRVVAKTFINWTGITFVAGQRYRFEVLADPPFDRGLWIDSGVRTTADGFLTCPVDVLCAPFRRLRRIPDVNWFVMSGGIGDPSLLALDLHHRFAIGDRRTITDPATGHLGLFANDVSTMYWNNEGAIMMTITRIE